MCAVPDPRSTLLRVGPGILRMVSWTVPGWGQRHPVPVQAAGCRRITGEARCAGPYPRGSGPEAARGENGHVGVDQRPRSSRTPGGGRAQDRHVGVDQRPGTRRRGSCHDRCFWVSATTFRTRLRPAWLRPCTWAIPRRNRNHPTYPNLRTLSRRSVGLVGRSTSTVANSGSSGSRCSMAPWRFTGTSRRISTSGRRFRSSPPNSKLTSKRWPMSGPSRSCERRRPSRWPGYSGTPIWLMTPVPLTERLGPAEEGRGT